MDDDWSRPCGRSPISHRIWFYLTVPVVFVLIVAQCAALLADGMPPLMLFALLLLGLVVAR